MLNIYIHYDCYAYYYEVYALCQAYKQSMHVLRSRLNWLLTTWIKSASFLGPRDPNYAGNFEGKASLLIFHVGRRFFFLTGYVERRTGSKKSSVQAVHYSFSGPYNMYTRSISSYTYTYISVIYMLFCRKPKTTCLKFQDGERKWWSTSTQTWTFKTAK